jgi:hypothetical protein
MASILSSSVQSFTEMIKIVGKGMKNSKGEHEEINPRNQDTETKCKK